MEFFLFHLALLGVAVLLTQSLTAIWRVGMVSLGHHGFFAAGAYGGAVVIALLAGSAVWPRPGLGGFVLGLLILLTCLVSGTVVAGIIGRVVAALTARLRDDYFAVATLIVAEMIQILLSNWAFVGGALGFEAPAVVARSGTARLPFAAVVALGIVALNAGLYLILRRIEGSIYGLFVTASRENELAAELAGVDVPRLRGLVFTLATGVAGLAGGLYLLITSVIVPADFSFIVGLPIVLNVVFGKLDARRCIVAAIVLYVAYEIVKLRCLGLLGPNLGDLLARWKDALLGVGLICGLRLQAAVARWRASAGAVPREVTT